MRIPPVRAYRLNDAKTHAIAKNPLGGLKPSSDRYYQQRWSPRRSIELWGAWRRRRGAAGRKWTTRHEPEGPRPPSWATCRPRQSHAKIIAAEVRRRGLHVAGRGPRSIDRARSEFAASRDGQLGQRERRETPTRGQPRRPAGPARRPGDVSHPQVRRAFPRWLQACLEAWFGSLEGWPADAVCGAQL